MIDEEWTRDEGDTLRVLETRRDKGSSLGS